MWCRCVKHSRSVLLKKNVAACAKAGGFFVAVGSNEWRREKRENEVVGNGVTRTSRKDLKHLRQERLRHNSTKPVIRLHTGQNELDLKFSYDTQIKSHQQIRLRRRNTFSSSITVNCLCFYYTRTFYRIVACKPSEQKTS